MNRRESLAEQAARKLADAHIKPDDPALVYIRSWNRDVLARAAGSPLSVRDSRTGQTRAT